MRAILSIGLGAALIAGLTVFTAAGCTAGIAPLSDGGGTSDGSADGSPRGTPSDATFQDGASCGAVSGTYDKTCNTVSDCTMVSRGCYCGATPVLGVAKTASVAAEACESSVAGQCPLGCPRSPGRVAEDGNSDTDGGTIQVLCDVGKCHTVVR